MTAICFMQVWKVGPGAWKPRAVTEQPTVMAPSADGAQVYTTANLDTEAYDRRALIIRRLDPHETTDPTGDYNITIASESYPEARKVIE
jgi:hypothetical protein